MILFILLSQVLVFMDCLPPPALPDSRVYVLLSQVLVFKSCSPRSLCLCIACLLLLSQALVFMDCLPLTSSGKPLRFGLAKRLNLSPVSLDTPPVSF